VDGLLGEVPVYPVGAPEKTKLLDEAVKVVREKTSSSRLPDLRLPHYRLADLYLYLQDVFLTNLACSDRIPISTLP